VSDPKRIRVRRDGDLVRVTLDDAERANALSPLMIEEVTAVYRRDWLGEGVRAVVLDAAGKNFSAGADLEHLRSLRDAGREENLADSRRLRDLFAAVLRQPALTVALVQGACVAGGCGLATAHDFVVAAEDARFMYSEVRIGFVAALVATFLPLRVSGRDARELLLDPDFTSAERALEIGLVNRVAGARRWRLKVWRWPKGAREGQLAVARDVEAVDARHRRPAARAGDGPRRRGQRRRPARPTTAAAASTLSWRPKPPSWR
jgi:methylglutaconyl-CoA hydratase